MIFRHRASKDIFGVADKTYSMFYKADSRNTLETLSYHYMYKDYTKEGILVQLSPTNIWRWTE